VVSSCRIRSSASAFKCGSASYGGFRKIRVNGLVIHDTYRSAVALESVDGGTFKDVRIENIRAANTGNAIFARLGHRNARAPVGQMEDIVIRDVKVEVPAGAPDSGYEIPGPPVEQPHNLIPSSITGLPGHPVRNVLFEDVEIVYAGGGKPERASVSIPVLSRLPERERDYPEFSMFGELPAWGFYARHAEGIELRGFRVTLKMPDFRPAMVFDDVRRLSLDRVAVGPIGGSPAIVLNDAREALVKSVNYPTDAPEKLRLMGTSSLRPRS
jgi:polygalacturonase